jgi:anthranilate/para-aminobenzoate synthase component II
MNHAVTVIGNDHSLIERLKNAHHVRQPVWPLAFHPESSKISK